MTISGIAISLREKEAVFTTLPGISRNWELKSFRAVIIAITYCFAYNETTCPFPWTIAS